MSFESLCAVTKYLGSGHTGEEDAILVVDDDSFDTDAVEAGVVHTGMIAD